MTESPTRRLEHLGEPHDELLHQSGLDKVHDLAVVPVVPDTIADDQPDGVRIAPEERGGERRVGRATDHPLCQRALQVG